MDSESTDNEVADLLAPFWSAQRTAEGLAVTFDELARRTRDGEVLGLSPGPGVAHYPVWQFHRLRDGSVRVKPGIATFVSALHGRANPWSIAILLRTPAAELGDQTPEQWVRAHGDDEVLRRFARHLAAEWTR